MAKNERGDADESVRESDRERKGVRERKSGSQIQIDKERVSEEERNKRKREKREERREKRERERKGEKKREKVRK